MQFVKAEMSPDQAKRTIAVMRSGDCLVYHVGNLLADRRCQASQLDQLGKFMLTAGVENGFQFSKDDAPIPGLGLGELTQRRIGLSEYEYIFTKS